MTSLAWRQSLFDSAFQPRFTHDMLCRGRMKAKLAAMALMTRHINIRCFLANHRIVTNRIVIISLLFDILGSSLNADKLEEISDCRNALHIWLNKKPYAHFCHQPAMTTSAVARENHDMA